ncbi:MAG: hypothetical protein IT553_01615 [Sphingomonadaceae bacterium]|nr:hypothetical protein [Sphingomonadaceae bacterium]
MNMHRTVDMPTFTTESDATGSVANVPTPTNNQPKVDKGRAAQMVFRIPDPSELMLKGQILRGKFIDAFTKIEAAVEEYLAKLDLKPNANAAFSQKLKLLGSAREQFCHPSKLDDRIQKIRDISEKRNDMVHAALTTMMQYEDGQYIQYWLAFQNVGQAGKQQLLITEGEMSKLIRDAKQLAAQFNVQKLKKEVSPAATETTSG